MENGLTNSEVKTGTTIVGINCKDGVVIATDMRGSAGNLVLSKNEKKAFEINDRFLIAGAGSGVAIQKIPKLLSAELRLRELRSKSSASVKQAVSLLSNIGNQGVAGFLVGGVNADGSTELYSLDPVGHISKVEEFDANFSSGMPFAYGLLERQYKEGISVKEGIELAKETIKAAIERDMGTGNGMEVYSITKKGIKNEFEERNVPEYNKK